MINGDTAKRMAIKFLRSEGCYSAAEKLKEGGCIEEIFELLVRGQGKQRVRRLYLNLPEQLRIYMFVTLAGSVNKSLEDKLCRIYGEYDQPDEEHRPERRKNFERFLSESQIVLLDYLR